MELPDQIYLGFTAHTGEVTGKMTVRYYFGNSHLTWLPDNHDVISVTTKTLIPKPKEAAPVKEPTD